MGVEMPIAMMQNWKRALSSLVVLLLVATTAAGQVPLAAPAEDGSSLDVPGDSQVVATVDGFALTVGRFNEAYVQHLIRTGGNDTPENRWARLNAMIRTRLLAGEARRRGLDERPEYTEYAGRQLRSAVAGRFFHQAVADSLEPLTDAEVREAFRRSKDEVVLRHLFFRDPAEAQAAYERLEQGTDFLRLANDVFDTAEFDSSAGFLGEASYWDLDDAVAEAAFALPVGAYSRPVRSSYGWHVLRVEERFRDPLLTESEYQYRREGTAGKLRLRRNRLAGDRFVRSFMNELEVQVEEDGMRLLADAVGQVLEEPEPGAAPRVALVDEEVAGLEASLTPETVLLTYTLDGTEHPFAALDFYRWLPEMKYVELRSRPAAAVGRALRNEVFARRGMAVGLDAHPLVEEAVDFYTGNYLANRLREQLQQTERVEPSDEQVREAYERLGYRRLQRAEADYWQVRFASLEEAEAALRQIRDGERAPASYETYAGYEKADLSGGDLEAMIRHAALDVPRVACTDAACYVVQVEDRAMHYTPLESVEEQIRERLATMLPEVELVEALYEQAEVEVDTALFERMMDLPTDRQSELIPDQPSEMSANDWSPR